MTRAVAAPRMHGARPDAARALCLFLHGRGQTPDEMVALVLSRLDAPGIAFALPHAPGNSWYAARAIDPLTPTTEEELAASLAQAANLIGALRRPGQPLLLAGFSQGACLSIELVLRGHVEPDALVAFTGCRVGTPACARPLRPVPGLPAYLSGSDADPWIPPAAFGDAAGALAAAGARLRAESHPGRPHTVSEPEIAVLVATLSTLSGAPPP